MSSAAALEVSQDVTTKAKNRLARAADSAKYLYDPKTGPKPTHFHTRTFLKSLRYFTIFAFWRLVRYAKYAAVGAIAAAVSGTVIGSVVSGAAFAVAPTGIMGGATIGLVWAIAKYGFRRVRTKAGGRAAQHSNPRLDEKADAGKVEFQRAPPRIEPW
ncbi:hypothetical protein LTR95_006901 [Oleoguttula sp. CCFEE 5521]